MMPTKGVGLPIPHESAVGHVTGAAHYTDDLAAQFPHCLVAFPVLSTTAHAKILHMDSSEALKIEGVVCVLSAADVPGINDVGASRRDEPLFPEYIQHHGQAIAWILANTEAAARKAARLIRLEQEELPALFTIEEAILAQSFLTESHQIQRGDVKTTVNNTPHKLSGQLMIGGQEHFYLETQAALAHRDEEGRIHVYASTQHPSETQQIVARVLGCLQSEVVCSAVRMGGAFGGKEVQASPFAAVAAMGVHRTGQAVRVRLPRREDMMMTGKRHPFLARYEVGFHHDGRIEALSVELWANGGYSLDLSDPIVWRAMFHIDNAYDIPHLMVRGRAVKTNLPSNTAFRGFGGPQGMLVIEDILTKIAAHLRRPSDEIRVRNFYKPGASTHYGQLVQEADRLHRVWAQLKTQSRYSQRCKEVEAYNQKHTDRKRGIAMTPVKFGISFTADYYNQAGASVLIFRDGSVQINHGGTEMGQGLHTKILQVASEVLALPYTQIRLMTTRTDKIPNTSATAASSGSDLNGAAVQEACEILRARLRKMAEKKLQSKDLLREGADYVRTTDGKRLSFQDLVEYAYKQRESLFATGHYRTPGIQFDPVLGQGTPFHYFAYGAACSEVEVDMWTGQHNLRAVDIVYDIGDSLSPLIDVGQIEGGFMQGYGWLCLEELVWDDAGRLRTVGPSTYKLPSLGECPERFRVEFLQDAKQAGVVFGSKAVGEPPLMLALSTRAALHTAIAAFGANTDAENLPPTFDLAMPSTPEAVFWAIEAVRSGVLQTQPKTEHEAEK